MTFDKFSIHHCDCLEFLPQIETESIDMILADLPYGETGNKWDKKLDLKELFKHYERIIKPDGAIVLNGSFKFGAMLYGIAPPFV